MIYPTDILLLPATCRTRVPPVTAPPAAMETPAVCCAACGDELDEPDVLCASCAEEMADTRATERIAQLERQLETTRQELRRTQQSLVDTRKVMLDQQRKIQRLLPATPPPTPQESDRVRFVTLRPTDQLQRLTGQQQVHDLLAAGWQIHSMIALPGDPPVVTVLLTHADQPATPRTTTQRMSRPQTVRSRPIGNARSSTITGKSAPVILDAHDPSITYADAIRAPHGTFSEAELDDIADREVHTAALRAFERAADPTVSDALTHLKTRRSSDDARQ
jgi:hypothetical protein